MVYPFFRDHESSVQVYIFIIELFGWNKSLRSLVRGKRGLLVMQDENYTWQGSDKVWIKACQSSIWSRKSASILNYLSRQLILWVWCVMLTCCCFFFTQSIKQARNTISPVCEEHHHRGCLGALFCTEPEKVDNCGFSVHRSKETDKHQISHVKIRRSAGTRQVTCCFSLKDTAMTCLHSNYKTSLSWAVMVTFHANQVQLVFDRTLKIWWWLFWTMCNFYNI